MEYLTVTLGSWVTPHTMEAWVPLMTLWSWGGLVMRVRAVREVRDMVSGICLVIRDVGLAP